MDSEKIIRLGLMVPMSGIANIYGLEIIRAAQIACQEVNEQGGILGKPLELIIEDDGSLPETAVKAAKKLVDVYHCHALIGNLLSNSRIAVTFRVAEPKKIPYLCFSLYEGSVLSRYYFHFAAIPNQQIDRMIPYMKEKFGPNMFFAGNNYEWPRGSINAAKKILLDSGGTVVGEEYCPIGCSTKEFDHLLDLLEVSGADVFVPFFAGTDQVKLLTLFTKRGFKSKFAVIMSHFDEAMASILTPEIRSGFFSCNTYFMTVDTKENHNILKKLTQLPGVNGIWPEGNGILTNFGEGTYLCVKAFATAANKVGHLETEALVCALETIRVTTPQGQVEMDPINHHAKVNTFLAQCQPDGKFSIIEHFGTIDPIIPERYSYLYLSPEAELSENIRIQSRIVEQMTQTIFFINSNNGNILYVNPGGERLFQYARGELIGKKISQLICQTCNQKTDYFQEINQILYQKGVWTGEQKNIKKDGTSFWTAVSISTFTHPSHGEVWMEIHKDITEQMNLFFKQKTTENQLVERDKLLSTVLHTLPVIVFVKDINHNFIYKLWNKFAEDIIGLKSEDVVGKSDYDILTKDDADWFKETDMKACKAQEIIDIPEEIMHTKNGPITLHTRKAVVRDQDGKPLLMVGVSEDISEIKKVANNLNNALEARDKFLIMASHELKTPITSITLRLQSMQRYLNLNDKITKEINTVVNQVEKLTKLINNIIDVTRVQTGKLILKLDKVNLLETATFVAGQLSQQLASSKCQVQTDISSEIEGMWDKARIEQLISNLFTNAIKYAPGSHILISATQDNKKTILIFRDSGPGISTEKKKLLFNRFNQDDTLVSVSGLGLGLYICKQIAEAHNGKIQIEDLEGSGASFMVELPNSTILI